MVFCPKCASKNIRFSRKTSSYDCEDCGHIWEEEKPFLPLRLFLSYGHDRNEELVRRIKADLEARGHTVWFDKADIKVGDDWRRAITDGILGSHRVLSFLSKHATRDPGVCLDEIAIAIGVKGGNIQTILVESETEVQPPASLSHLQWLDMHDWQTHQAAGASVWEPWYQGKLAEIVHVVESDESRRFAGEIATLSEYLKPITSDSRIAALLRKSFIGRTWLAEAIEEWRNAPDRASRLFWITGDPGVGKSAFAAHLTHFGRDTVIAAQFVEWDKPDHRSPQRVIRSLAFQLATRLPDYRKLLLTLPEIAELDRKDPAELFDYLLANPLRSVIYGGRARYLLVIDALDEAGEGGRNSLVELLARDAHRLPDWLGLVVTSRPESTVTTPLQGLNPFVFDTRTEANRADLRAYLHHALAPQLTDCPDADRLIEQILDKSEGVFLYVERFCDDVHHTHVSLDHPDRFPQGLGGSFFQFFQRQFPDLDKFRKEVRPALRAILAAREPLPVEILQRLFNWQDEELRDFTRALGSMFPVTKEANSEVIKPYHKSLADWLADEDKAKVHYVSVIEGHHLLGEFCFVQWKDGSRFALSEIVYHLQFDVGPKKLLDVLVNPAYYEEKFAKCGLNKLYDDLNCFASRPGIEPSHISLDECVPEVRAVFSIAAFILLCRELSRCTIALRRFVENGCKKELLETEREKLKTQISSAESQPRTRRAETNHYAANTAHFYEDYTEHLLKAEDAALALKPAQMLASLRTALRFYAIYSCDGDPIGAVNIAIQEAAEDFNAGLPVLETVALRLDAGIPRRPDTKT